jgi:NAD(P)-dependent dehydrogenase (short-subunit alcohol dehydrogenase family)
MERALVIGASGGIGSALAGQLAARGADVTRLSRADGFDLMDPGSLAGLTGVFDRVMVATGILAPAGEGPEKALAAIRPAAMAEVLAVNAIGPALILAQLSRLIPRDRPARIGLLSARVGSIGDNRLGGWHSYRAAKAALNQIVRGAAVEYARTRPQAVVAALHPGTVATRFGAAQRGTHPALTPDQSAKALLAVLDGLTPAQSGGFYDWQGAAVPW